MTHLTPLRHRILAALLTFPVALFLIGAEASAAPAPPPGGHIPVYFAGANTGAYPALSPTSVPDRWESLRGSSLQVTSAPNPFRKTTLLRFAMGAGEKAQVRIFSPSGREIRELELAAPGTGLQEVLWDGRDTGGTRLPSGVYLYRVTVGIRSAVGKLVFLQ